MHGWGQSNVLQHTRCFKLNTWITSVLLSTARHVFSSQCMNEVCTTILIASHNFWPQFTGKVNVAIHRTSHGFGFVSWTRSALSLSEHQIRSASLHEQGERYTSQSIAWFRPQYMNNISVTFHIALHSIGFVIWIRSALFLGEHRMSSAALHERGQRYFTQNISWFQPQYVKRVSVTFHKTPNFLASVHEQLKRYFSQIMT